MSKPVEFSIRFKPELNTQVERFRNSFEIKPSKCEAVVALVMRGLLLSPVGDKKRGTKRSKFADNGR